MNSGRGGKREGAGRPKPVIPNKMRSMRLTDSEYQQLKDYLKQIRSDKNENLFQ